MCCFFHNSEVLSILNSTQCCIVGAGPAGVVLSLLLARQGIAVHLLEVHNDLDRDFRGDTVHASTLEALDQIGLADKVLALPHAKMQAFSLQTPKRRIEVAQFYRLKTKFPYVALMPQAPMLNLLLEEAKSFANFHVSFDAAVTGLTRADDRVTGITYRKDNQNFEVSADLVVACDGRFSKLRKLIDPVVHATSAPMDVAWLRLPKHESDPTHEGGFYVAKGKVGVLLERDTEWQIGYVFPKGDFGEIRSQGIGQLRRELGEVIPLLADRTNHISGFSDVHMLNVKSDFVETWHEDGLILLGDAAHTMSPVGGVGINYAIGDAIVAANVLYKSFKSRIPTRTELVEIQRIRQSAVRRIQRIQSFGQNSVVSMALKRHEFELPLVARMLLATPFVRDVPAKAIAFGFDQPRIECV